MRIIIVLCTAMLVASHNIEYAKRQIVAIGMLCVVAFLWDMAEIYYRK